MPLRKRAARRQHLVELPVGSLEAFLGYPLERDRVAGLDLLGVRDLLAGELAGDGLESPQLSPEILGVGFVRKLPRVGSQLLRLAGRLSLDALGDLLRAVVVVRELLVVADEAEAKLDVALGDAHRSNRAAWPWPTPTHRVARP
jgi:hypothetical protein